MTELAKNLAVDQTKALIESYGFDLQGCEVSQLIDQWLECYHASWLRLATIEALYLGRYKTFSINQILLVWSRLGSPSIHFTLEFERMICRKLPRNLVFLSEPSPRASSQKASPPQSKIVAQHSCQIDSCHNCSKNQSAIASSPTSTNSEPRLAKADFAASEPDHKPEPAQLDFSTPTNGTRTNIDQTPIDQFVPLPDVSPLFEKLKAVAQQNREIGKKE